MLLCTLERSTCNVSRLMKMVCSPLWCSVASPSPCRRTPGGLTLSLLFFTTRCRSSFEQNGRRRVRVDTPSGSVRLGAGPRSACLGRVLYVAELIFVKPRLNNAAISLKS